MAVTRFDVEAWLDKSPEKEEAMIIRISPEQAARLLIRNRENRPIKKTKLSVYTQNMADDKFPLTSSSIAFDSEGTLQNGQHRLQACAASGKALHCIVAKGLAPMSFLYEDIHIKRSVPDVLSIRRESNYKILASALSYLYRYRNEVAWRNRKLQGLKTVDSSKRFHNPSRLSATTVGVQNDVALALLEQHPGIRESVSLYSSHRATLIPAGAIATLHYEGSRVNRERTERFLDVIQSGVGHDPDAPEVALVRTLQNSMASRRSRIHPYKKFEYAMKALYFALSGRKLRQLRLSPDEEVPLLEDLIDGIDRTLPPVATSIYMPGRNHIAKGP